MDVSIMGSGARFPGLAMLQTQEIVYPILDDPYVLGCIACTALLSNMYAVGVCEVRQNKGCCRENPEFFYYHCDLT